MASSILATNLTWRAFLRTSSTVGASLCMGDLICQALTAPALLKQSSTPSASASSSSRSECAKSDSSRLECGKSDSSLAVTWDGNRRTLNVQPDIDDVASAPVFVVDLQRMSIMAVCGTCITGPVSHTWMVLMEYRIPGSAPRAIALKTIANAVLAFVVSLPLMFTAVTLLKGGTWEAAMAKIEKDRFPTFVTGLAFWPFANVALFRWCALENRAIVNGMCGVVWNIYLSNQATKV
eukprot:GEMP01040985.1.p1 GENE.GEMP01040985.1~~GEMP01040985.1.p1  ORF type:complete len:236 (+),score=59.11 GEMP01040985.1:197-904(+)